MSSGFILGIIAGEGSFYVALYLKDNDVVRPAPSFSVKMGDTDLLVRMKNEVGVGRIVTRNGGPTTWQVQAEQECRTLRSYIEENSGEYFEISSKNEQYLAWSKALDIVEGIPNTQVPKSMKKDLIDISFNIAKSDNGRSVSKQEWYARVQDE